MAGKHGPRKLLIASVGVATINYVLGGCGHVTETPDKGPSGGSSSAGAPPTSGNLPAPGGSVSGGSPTVANLPAPVMGNGGNGGNGSGATSGKAGSGGGGDAGEAGAPTTGNLVPPPLPGGSGGKR
jgi:hypothetical protein